MKRYMAYEMKDVRLRGGHKETWQEVVENDFKSLLLDKFIER